MFLSFIIWENNSESDSNDIVPLCRCCGVDFPILLEL